MSDANTLLWSPVRHYEGLYEVASDGQVRSLPRRVRTHRGFRVSPGKVLNPRRSRGYAHVSLSSDGVARTFQVHRLVLQSFYGDAELSGAQVNHINGDKQDNRIENLEWVTVAENIRHKFDVLKRPGVWKGKKGNLHPHSQKVAGYDCVTGDLVCIFESMNEAQRAGYSATKISSVVNGARKKHKGLVWARVS